MISVINNISSLVAENAVSGTQNNLQTTLQQLSTGLRINSGADDPAGLAIAEGLGANISALNQSSQNATNGIGFLQTADGALSQVATVLNQAITIATEASNGGLSSSQSSALNTEFQAILTQINNIGTTTNFNGTSVFSASNDFLSQQASLAATTALTTGDTVSINDSATGGNFVFKAAAGNTIATLQTAITNAISAGTLDSGVTATFTGGKLEIKTSTAGASLNISSSDPVLGPFSAATGSSGSLNTYLSDGTSTGSQTLSTNIGGLSTASLTLTGLNLSTAASAQTALSAVTAAIATVAQNRGDIGAGINSLTSDSAVETTEVQNLTSAQNGVQNANIAQTTSSLAQYNILEQTGFDALSQANSAEQNVLKLLQ